MWSDPPDPIRPVEPVVIARERPFTVAVAGAFLYGSGAVGLVAALALLTGAGPVVNDLYDRAVALGVEPAAASDVTVAVRTTLLSSGTGVLALSLLSLLLAWGVLRRSEAARVGALVVAVASLGCGLVRTSVTAFGNGVDWSMTTRSTDPMLPGRIAQAFGEAMPGWLVGLGGGLTDLQSLGYIAVAVLLIVPVSRRYFQSRMAWYTTNPAAGG